MKYFRLCLSLTAGSLIAVGCGDSDSNFHDSGGGRGGDSSGGDSSGDSGGSSSPSGGAGTSGASGSSSVGGAAGEGADTGEAGSGASAGTDPGSGGEGGSGPCANCGTTSLAVPGGDFLRSYDGEPGIHDDDAHPATVSSFRLDEYEVTVGEVRGFVAAAIAGYRPDAGSGKHSHLNAGMGLVNTGAGGGYESGWDSDWEAELLDSAEAWNEALACNSPSNWTPEAGANESLPMHCMSWYQAYAYCIWTGGFLPSEAEWNYAAAGGNEQRPFPWGPDAPEPTLVVFGVSQAAGVGSKPAGDGRWGHADLAGNLAEWTLDSFADYETPCVDCASLDDSGDRVVRGGSYVNSATDLFRTAHRGYAGPSGWLSFGFRCARPPAE